MERAAQWDGPRSDGRGLRDNLGAAHGAAKAADPDCQIGIAAKSVAINYLDQAIAAGSKGHFDYITLHPYEVGGCTTITHPGTELVYLQIRGTVRKMLAARDPAKIDCPIIFTELGFAAGGQYSHKIANFSPPEVQGQALVKYYTMGIAQGISRNKSWRSPISLPATSSGTPLEREPLRDWG